MAGFNNDRIIGTALLLPTTAAPTVFGPIGSIYINNSRFLHAFGTNNTFLGTTSGNYTLTGTDSAAIGFNALVALTNGSNNSALGSGALSLVTSGANNIGLGKLAGSTYTTESNNIAIGNTGTIADSNTIRIGTQGGGAGQQNRNFQAGIYGVTPAVALPLPVVIDSAGQLGTDSGAGIVVTLTGNNPVAVPPTAGNINIVNANTTVDITGNAGTSTLTVDFGLSNLLQGSSGASITSGLTNVGYGLRALNAVTSGSANTAMGYQALLVNTTGTANMAIGGGALAANISGGANMAVGTSALNQCTTGNQNSAIGTNALLNMTTGTNNVAIGYNSMSQVSFITGSYNVSIGAMSGTAFLTNESHNISINSVGVVTDSNTLRIGAATGSGQQQLNRAFICGIDGVNVGSVAKVVTMASDQLGTATITAGTGITVTPGANSITISSSGADLLAYTSVNSSPYVVLAGDEFLGVDCSVIPITVQLPNAPSTGRVYIIKDSTGSANTNNITVTTVGGAVNIDGATTYVMNTQYASIQVLFDGSTYQIF